MTRNANWKQRILQETGMPYMQAVALLAKRGHSKKGVAAILGIGKDTFFRYCNDPTLPWVPREETIEFQECRRNRVSSRRLYDSLKDIHRRKTLAACHQVQGKFGTIEVLAAHFGRASARTARRRIAAGWSVADAVLTPALKR
ncbi:hypothetical protein D3C78_1446540 [compost metagenome]